jgi:hypothetical protein
VWSRVADDDPDALPSQTPEWLDTLPARFVDVSRLYETSDGIRAVLPLVRDRRFPGVTPVEASYPRTYGFGGVVVEGGVSAHVVAAVAGDVATGSPLSLSIWPNPLQGEHWERALPTGWARTPRRAHVVHLDGGADAVWSRMSGNGRRGVRRAERSEVHIETDCSGALLPVYFELQGESRERWARGRHEPAWLARWRARRDTPDAWQRTIRALRGRCRVSIASWQGRPVAGTIVLLGPNAHYTHGAMRKEQAARCYANYALHWHEIRAAIADGARTYQMGESGASASLARFKEQFGARVHDYADYRYERLPFSRLDHGLRAVVKRAIGFREPS